MYPVLVPFLFNPVGMNKSFGFFSSSTVFYEWDIIFRRTKKKNGNCIKHIFIARQGNTFNLYCTSATRKILYKLIQFDVLRTHKEISIFCLFFILFVLSRGYSKEFRVCVYLIVPLRQTYKV